MRSVRSQCEEETMLKRVDSPRGKLRSAYDEWHRRLERPDTVDSPWHRLVLAHLPPDLDGVRILDIACGRGGLAVELGRRGANVVAVDFSQQALTRGRELADRQGIGGVAFELGDIQAIDHRSGEFDVVVSCETIEHVPT